MTIVHFVYPHGPQIAAPNAIGREVGLRLRQHYQLFQYEWDDFKRIEPSSDAILIGHAHPAPWTIFRQSARSKGWKRIILLAPFHHGDISQVAFIDHFIRQVDLFLAITGNYWFETIDHSAVSHWAPKVVHVDLAVDRTHFPPLKHQFNQTGKRRFLYIGNSHRAKNLPWLNAIATSLPEYEFSWIGSKEGEFEGLTHLGPHDFSTTRGKEIVAQHDFLITVGQADANPTTILEAMAWGLIPVCTVQSGYRGFPGIINVPLNDTDTTVQILKELQNLPEDKLLHLQSLNWQALDEHFNWDRFAQQVIDAIESNEGPPLGYESVFRKAQFRMAEVQSYTRHRTMRRAVVDTAFNKFVGKNHILAKWTKSILMNYGNRR